MLCKHTYSTVHVACQSDVSTCMLDESCTGARNSEKKLLEQYRKRIYFCGNNFCNFAYVLLPEADRLTNSNLPELNAMHLKAAEYLYHPSDVGGHASPLTW